LINRKKQNLFVCLWVIFFTLQTLFLMSIKATPVVIKEVYTIEKKVTPSKKKIKKNNYIKFIATAYTLWETPSRSYNKSEVHTKDGTNLKYKSRRQAMTIAVDPSIIPIGTNVYIKFPKPYTQFNGVYVAHDTGKKVKGNHIDIFLGCRTKIQHQDALNFGVRQVQVRRCDK
jgi:3D (Asp-Asp-Asp) domain-containing protein